MSPSPRPFLITGLALIALALVANEWVLGHWLTEAGRVTNPGTRLVIGAFDLGALAAGLVLVVRRHRAPWREMLLMAGAVVVALGLLEAGLRAWFAVRTSMSPQEREIAATIGWRPIANASYETVVPGFGDVRYTTTRGGFRVFGDTGTSKPKLLVIGDSYTEAAMVSDGETYYQRLAAWRPDLEWFAIGGGGYGTLQEFMLLDEWVDTIRPSMVLVQLHPNNLINNSHALESRSTTNNNQMTRPYWDQGRVVSRFPENEAWGPLYNLVRHSYLLRLFNVNLHALRSRSADSAERTLTRDDPDVSRAIDTTVELLENSARGPACRSEPSRRNRMPGFPSGRNPRRAGAPAWSSFPVSAKRWMARQRLASTSPERPWTGTGTGAVTRSRPVSSPTGWRGAGPCDSALYRLPAAAAACPQKM